MRPSPIDQHRQAILITAGQAYRAHTHGVAEFDPDQTQVNIAPPEPVNELSTGQAAELAHVQAQVNVAANAMVRVALLADRIEAGGIDGLFARIWFYGERVFSRGSLRHAFGRDGIVSAIRHRRIQPRTPAANE